MAVKRRLERLLPGAPALALPPPGFLPYQEARRPEPCRHGSRVSCEPAAEWRSGPPALFRGVTFRGGGRVFATPYDANGKSILNGFWSVQSKGSMISQRLPRRKRGEGASQDWRVFFSKAGLTRAVREDRWFFAEAPNAFVGVCVVDGDAAFSEEAPRFGQWLVCENKDTPVILEAGRKSDFESFEAFSKRTLAQSVSMENSVLTYRSLGGDTLTFSVDRSRLPEINGKPVELAPDKVYDSPFVQSDWDSGVVTIQFGDEKRILDFN